MIQRMQIYEMMANLVLKEGEITLRIIKNPSLYNLFEKDLEEIHTQYEQMKKVADLYK